MADFGRRAQYGQGESDEIVTVKMVEVLDDKVKDLLVPDAYINLREEENKSHMFGAVEIRISKLQEGRKRG